MNRTLDEAIRYTVLVAKDDADAMRKLVFQTDEIHIFYRQTFGYPLEEEVAFAGLVYKFKQATATSEKMSIVGEMAQMARRLWYDKIEHYPSGKGKESASLRVFEEIDGLRRAVEDGDEKMCGYRLNYLSGSSADEDYFRQFLVELNDGNNYWKIGHFEMYLLQVTSAIRYLNTIEAGGNQYFDQLGLDVATEYLNDEVSEIRMDWLTDLILLLLFDVLILGLKISSTKPSFLERFQTKTNVDVWLPNLLLFRNEIASRHYDSSELIRRLRSFEDAKSTYVIPSLVYPLLELQMRRRPA